MSDFPENETTGRLVSAAIWWMKAAPLPWIIQWVDGSTIACKTWRLISGHCVAKSVHMGDVPPHATREVHAPAGWLEVVGELVIEGAQRLGDSP